MQVGSFALTLAMNCELLVPDSWKRFSEVKVNSHATKTQGVLCNIMIILGINFSGYWRGP